MIYDIGIALTYVFEAIGFLAIPAAVIMLILASPKGPRS